MGVRLEIITTTPTRYDMAIGSTQQWESLERWSPTAFRIAGAMFAVAAAVVVVAIVAGGWERLALMAEAFMGAGWIVSLIGLLGLYPVLATRRRWLARAGAVFAALGVVTWGVVVAVSLIVFAAGSRPDSFPVPQMVILPGMLSGTVLAFVAVSVATLRSDIYSRALGLLLLGPTALFLANAFIIPLLVDLPQDGVAPPELALGFASTMTLAVLAVGYRLRTEGTPTDRDEQAPETPAV